LIAEPATSPWALIALALLTDALSPIAASEEHPETDLALALIVRLGQE